MNFKKQPAGITTRIRKSGAEGGISHHRPVGFSVLKHSDRVEVKVRPPFRLILIFFPLGWYGFLALWYVGVFKSGEWFMGLFALIHVFAGLIVLKHSFAMVFSRTRIIIDEGGLTLRKTPRLKDNTIHIKRDALDQFYVTKTKKGHNLILQSGDDHIEILTALTSYEHARYVEDFLEEELGVVDRKVPGEDLKPSASRVVSIN